MRIFLATVSLLAVLSVASATIYDVGATEKYKTLKSVLGLLHPGDEVDIDPGVYAEVNKITCSGTPSAPIIIRGVGATKPIFDATGLSVSGSGSTPRAIFQIEGANVILDNLEMRNARNGNNGAGVRLNNSTNAVVNNCKVSYCDMGFQGGDVNTAHINYCDVGFNGTPAFDGFSHNFYMDGNGISVYGCYIHDSLYGQNYKSRAHYNELWYNVIANSNEGEVGPVDSATTATPNSNMVMVGNVISSKKDRTGNYAKFIAFGQDGGGDHNGTLYMYNNTCIAGSPSIGFLDVNAASSAVVATNNIFYGSRSIVQQWDGNVTVPVTGSNNWLPSSIAAPDGWTDSVQGITPGLRNGPTDARLASGSACVDQGAALGDLYYVDGSGVRHSISSVMSPFTGPAVFPRLAQGPTDIGAYEYITTPTLSGDANGDGAVDGADYTIWANHVGATGVPPWLDGGGAYGNFNDDLVVNADDYARWNTFYNQTYAGSDVPEPAGLMVLALSGLAALRRRK